MISSLKQVVVKSVSNIDKITRSKVRVILSNKIYSVPEIENIRRFVDDFKVDCIFDVGANYGQYARMLRDDVEFKGTIISFEPIPECAAHLRRIAAKDANWIVEELALTDRSGTVTFNIMEESQFSSILKPDHNNARFLQSANSIKKAVEVHAETVESYIDKNGILNRFKRPYLKMDTQGNDLLVASGAGDNLKAFVGIQSELSVVSLYENSPNYLKSLEFYNSKGFYLTALFPNNEGHFPRLLETDCIMYNPAFTGHGRD